MLLQLETRQDLRLLSPVVLHREDLHNTNTETKAHLLGREVEK